jgi:hypothetical protein
MYYVISLKHTMRNEKFITLWRPDNKGYCMNKEWAGTYETIEEGYHNSEGQLPIKVEDAEGLFIRDTEYWGVPHLAMPNTKAVWDMLGVKMTKNGLVKKVSSSLSKQSLNPA